MSKMRFEDLLVKNNGIIKGPFGGDIKKSLFVPKSNTTYKVYEQGVVLNKDVNIGNYYISEDYFKNKLSRFEVKEGDILLTGAGTIGELYEIPNNAPKGLINQALLRVRVNEDVVDKDYFKYYFKYYLKSILSKINGDSVIPNLPPLQKIKDTEVDIPCIEVQRQVANILGKIDHKININTKINQKLEQFAKSIYDYWFMQFEFPNEEEKPYKSSGGKMVWNEKLKIEIPSGWKVEQLSDFANITMGQSPKGSSYNEVGEGEVFYQGRTDFGCRFPKIRVYTTEPSRMANKGEILLSVRAPVGDINIANENCCIGRGLSALSSKDGYNSYLYYLMLKLKSVFDIFNSSGTTFGAITKDFLYEIKIVSPSNEIIERFEGVVKAFDDLIYKNEQENRELEQIRDWFLPMLMNGQVSFK